MVTFTWCVTAKTGSSLMVPSNVKVDLHYNWQKRKFFFRQKHKLVLARVKEGFQNLNFSYGIQITIPNLLKEFFPPLSFPDHQNSMICHAKFAKSVFLTLHVYPNPTLTYFLTMSF